MLHKGIRKYIYSPVVGLLPFVLYLLLHISEDIGELCALTISLAVAVVAEIITRYRYKTKMYSLTYYTSIIAILLTLVFWALTHHLPHAISTYIIFCEIIIIVILFLLKLSKVYIAALFFRKKSVLQKAWLNEFYHVISMIRFGLVAHLLVYLNYLNFGIIGAAYTNLDIVMLVVVPAGIIVCIGIYNLMRTGSLADKLRKEEWLPIVTEKGEVTGKIAKSVSIKMKNRFLHPVVRVALVSNGKVYLQERTYDCVIDGGKLDYPFEKYMLFDHEINLAARNSISRMMGTKIDIPIKFLLKYILENTETKRLVLLFIANIDDESKIKRKGKMQGKFWTVKQIENNFADGIFSESFELEFEYLKNTILEATD